jgi:hypothetical protein
MNATLVLPEFDTKSFGHDERYVSLNVLSFRKIIAACMIITTNPVSFMTPASAAIFLSTK